MSALMLLWGVVKDLFGAVFLKLLSTKGVKEKNENIESTANPLSDDELAAYYGLHNRGED